MIVAVFDTNVLLFGFVRRNPASAAVQALDAWRAGRFGLVISDHILAEFKHALEEPYFARRISPRKRAAAITLLRSEAIHQPITVSVQCIATHPEDDLVLATAISGQVQYLVTGDAKLLILGTYHGVRLVGPREFLDLVEAETQSDDDSDLTTTDEQT